MARNMFDGIGVYVTVTNPKIRYAFKSKMEDDKIRAALGQTDITGKVKAVDAAKGSIVVSPSYPKPKRASKKFATGYSGSYCSDDKVGELKEDGWIITKGKMRFAKSNPLTDTCFVKINGINYAWQLSKPKDGKIPDTATTGGVVKSNVGASDIVWAADFPKPPRVMFPVGDGNFSTFYSPAKEGDLAKIDGVTLLKSDYLHSDEELLAMFGIVKSAPATK